MTIYMRLCFAMHPPLCNADREISVEISIVMRSFTEFSFFSDGAPIIAGAL